MRGYECCLFLVLLFGDAYFVIYVSFCFLAIPLFGLARCNGIYFVSAKIRSLSEGVVPLFHNYLYVIKIYRDLC